MQSKINSGNNYNEIGRLAKSIRSYDIPHEESQQPQTPPNYDQKGKMESKFLDLREEQWKNEEPSSHINEELEKSYSKGGDVENHLSLKKDRRMKTRTKKKSSRCWKRFRRIFKPEGKSRHHHHSKKRKLHREHRRQNKEEFGLFNEKYPTMYRPLTNEFVSPTEVKMQEVPTSHPVPIVSLAPDKEEEKDDFKLKPKEKFAKSTSAEPIEEKTPKVAPKIKTGDEPAPMKDEHAPMKDEPAPMKDEHFIEEEQLKIRQSQKIIQFIKQIAKLGTDGIKNDFINCRSHIPSAVTKTAHDQNLIRCRYQDLICIDQTRVVIKCDQNSDFIHANRIPLGNNPNEIIITQLPLSNTVKDFWGMVWQEDVQAILLLLTLREWQEHAENINLIPKKGRCLHICDTMMLTHKNEIRVTSNWMLHEFYLTNNNETHRVIWHHYTAWEPNEQPADGEHFWSIQSSMRKMRRPYICMSLAGAGRAGCYAALEWAHLMLHDKNVSSIDVSECVRKVRTYRMHAVQTTAQFQFIYMGILRHIFLVEKIQKEMLADPGYCEETKKCLEIEQKYYQCRGNYPTDDDFDLENA